MGRPLFIVLGGMTLLALVLTLALSSVMVNRDIVTELVPTSVIVEVPVSALSQPSTSGNVGINIEVTSNQDEFLRYEVELTGHPIALIDDIELPDVLLMYREVNTQRSLSAIADGATTLVLAIETRAFRPDNAPPWRMQVIALDDEGTAIASDWRDPVLQEQIALLSDAVVTEGVTWVEALEALVDAARDRELEREIDTPLGQRLLDVVSP